MDGLGKRPTKLASLILGLPWLHEGNIGTGPTHVTISGYSVLQAESMEALEEECKDHPHIGWHPEAYIEFFELALF